MGAFVFAAACAASGIMFGLWGAASPAGTIDGYPPAICYAFATLAVMTYWLVRVRWGKVVVPKAKP